MIYRCHQVRVLWIITMALFQYKDCLSRYGYFHYNDKMFMRLSYLYNGKSYADKTIFILRWAAGPYFHIKTVFPGIRIPIRDCLIFIMGIHWLTSSLY